MPRSQRTFSYGKQSISQADKEAVLEALSADFLTQGPLVEQFEQKLCQYTGAKYAVAVANGTVALHLAAMALEVGVGDEVMTSPNTFLASANCAVYCGARPTFADIEPETANIDPKKIKDKITKRTKLLIPVHFAGQSCDMEAISELAKEHQIRIIEDAAHAIGSRYKNDRVGACRYSDMTTFSFHPVKTITTAEGGAITTNDPELYEKLLLLRSHGMTRNKSKMEKWDGPWDYEMHSIGYNGRITDLQCALGISQLKRLDAFVEKRRAIVKEYRKLFQGDERFSLLQEKEGSEACFHLCPILLNPDILKKPKCELFQELAAKGLRLQVHYIPVHTQPFYRRFGYKPGDFPEAEKYYRKTLSLPLYPDLTMDDVHEIVGILKELVV